LNLKTSVASMGMPIGPLPNELPLACEVGGLEDN